MPVKAFYKHYSSYPTTKQGLERKIGSSILNAFFGKKK